MRKHWAIDEKAEYFHIEGHEWPRLLVEVAKWLVETNTAVDGIVLREIFTDDHLASDDHYVCATVYYTSSYTEPAQDPFELEDLDESAFVDDIFGVLEKHGMLV